VSRREEGRGPGARTRPDRRADVTRAALSAAAVVLLVVLAAPWVWLSLTGDFFMTVQGRSMVPTYDVGDVLVVRGPSGEELASAGEVVVVTREPGAGRQGAMYVHRVVEPLLGGEAWLQGDGNPTRDPRPVDQEAVVGTPRLALTAPVAVAFAVTQSVAGRVVLAGAALALLLLPRRAPGDARQGEPGHGSSSRSGGRRDAR